MSDFSLLHERARAIRAKYAQFEQTKYGKEWTKEQLVQGFVVDVGELMEIVMAKSGIRTDENLDEKLKHELSDCLWSIFVIADQYNIDLEQAFLQTMDQLDKRLSV